MSEGERGRVRCEPPSAHPADTPVPAPQGPGGGSLLHRWIPRLQLWDGEKASVRTSPIREGASERGGEQVGIPRGCPSMGGAASLSPSLSHHFQLPLPGSRGGKDLLVHGGRQLRHLRARCAGNGECLGGPKPGSADPPSGSHPASPLRPGPSVPGQRSPMGVAQGPPSPRLLPPRSGVL